MRRLRDALDVLLRRKVAVAINGPDNGFYVEDDTLTKEQIQEHMAREHWQPVEARPALTIGRTLFNGGVTIYEPLTWTTTTYTTTPGNPAA